MRKIDDTHFAKVLLEMGRIDETRLDGPECRNSDISVALWTAHELRRHAEELKVEPDLSKQLRGRADEIVRHAARVRTVARVEA